MLREAIAGAQPASVREAPPVLEVRDSTAAVPDPALA
jgi:hypothetical protein